MRYSLSVATIDAVRAYWNRHIHDLEITRHPVGSRGFFDDLDQYHFEKLHHLLRLVDFDGWRGRRVLEVGCGAGVDLARFAKGGADRHRRRPRLVGDRSGARQFRAAGPPASSSRGQRRAVAVSGRIVRSGVRARRRAVHRGSAAARRRVPPRAEAGRRGDLPGLQPACRG